MAPVVHGLEVEYYGQVNFAYLDVDDAANEAIKRELGYRVQPHFFLVDSQGYVVEQWLGRVDAAEFRAAFDAALAQ